MILLVIGFFVIVSGILAMGYPELVQALKEEDSETWHALGSPPPRAFHKTIGVYLWLLGKGYQSSKSENVRILGEKARPRSKFTKMALLLGVGLIILGFGLALAGY